MEVKAVDSKQILKKLYEKIVNMNKAIWSLRENMAYISDLVIDLERNLNKENEKDGK